MRKVLLLLILLTGLAPTAWAATVKTTHRTIPSWDGTPLGAFVIEPQDAGSGRYPLLVMPSSWAVPSVEYVGVAQTLAQRGYVVISYSSRGFWESGGSIDIAGPATVEDVSALIDWALDNTRADPERIGVSGISYGAGTSLLAAARDPRIKAVAALSGWADLQASLYSHDTPSAQGIALLVAAGLATGRPGAELATINRNVLVGNYQGAVDTLLPVAAQRSPASSVDEINANQPAVFLANAFNDSLFPPGQLVDFFNRLKGPKQLQLRHGDHALNEAFGALGIPNEVYAAVGDWFDHYLKGVANGIDRQAPVQLKSQKGSWSRYPDWQATNTGAVNYGLTAPTGLLLPTGGLAENGGGTGWNYRIGSGLLTAANGRCAGSAPDGHAQSRQHHAVCLPVCRGCAGQRPADQPQAVHPAWCHARPTENNRSSPGSQQLEPSGRQPADSGGRYRGPALCGHQPAGRCGDLQLAGQRAFSAEGAAALM